MYKYANSYSSDSIDTTAACIPSRVAEIRLRAGEYVILKDTYTSGKVFHHLVVSAQAKDCIMSKAKLLLSEFDNFNTGKELCPLTCVLPVYGLAGTGKVYMFKYVTKGETTLLSSKEHDVLFRAIYWDRSGKNGVSLTGLQSIDKGMSDIDENLGSNTIDIL